MCRNKTAQDTKFSFTCPDTCPDVTSSDAVSWTADTQKNTFNLGKANEPYVLTTTTTKKV